MSKNQVRIVPIETFNLNYEDRNLGEFKVESKWENFVKLKRLDGKVVIIEDTSSFIDKMFQSYFGGVDSPEPRSFNIVSMSPDLMLP